MLLSRIEKGESVPPSALVPYLRAEQREERAKVNVLLAQAYLDSGREDFLQYAKVFVGRAWTLSRFSPDVLPLYTKVHVAVDDIIGIRAAYKRLGMLAAGRRDISEAIRYFDLWQRAYHTFKRVDEYEYDFDVLECMDRLAEPHRLPPRVRVGSLEAGQTRVAYLVKGIIETGSVLVKINLHFAQFHDRSRFDPLFFVPEAERTVRASPAGREHLRRFASHGCKVMMAPNVGATDKRLLGTARMIHDASPHLLIAGAALADFGHYFITSLRPAPVIAGFVQGPPEQFAPLVLDWGLAWSDHPLMDSPVGCSRIDMEMELPKRSEVVPCRRDELRIPEDAIVLGSAGRHVKFQDADYWRAILELLDDYPDAYYLIMGVEEGQIPFLRSLLSRETRARMRFVPWRGDDYLRALCQADIVLDTFPSGGGTVLWDAMSLGIPIVTFRNNYMRRYDQADWSPIEEGMIEPDIIVPRGDFAEMKNVVSRLIEDPEYRRAVGRRVQDHLWLTRSQPERAVRACERVYRQILESPASRKGVREGRRTELDQLAHHLARPSAAHGDLAWMASGVAGALRLGGRIFDHVSGTAYEIAQALRFGGRLFDRLARGESVRVAPGLRRYRR